MLKAPFLIASQLPANSTSGSYRETAAMLQDTSNCSEHRPGLKRVKTIKLSLPVTDLQTLTDLARTKSLSGTTMNRKKR